LHWSCSHIIGTVCAEATARNPISECRLSPAAQSDLDGIWDPTFPIWNAFGQVMDENPVIQPCFHSQSRVQGGAGLAEHVMLAIWLQNARITAC
jgi:hypothetical protein